MLPVWRLRVAGWPARWLLAAWLVYSLGIILAVRFAGGFRFLLPILVLAYVAPFVAGPERLARVLRGRRPEEPVGHRRHPEAGAGAADRRRATTTAWTTTRRTTPREIPADRAGRPARRRRVRRGRRAGDGRPGRGRRGGACRSRRRGSAPGGACADRRRTSPAGARGGDRAARVRGCRRSSRPRRRGRRCERAGRSPPPRTPANVARLEAAHVIHLPGGDPDLLPAVLRGTPAWAAILRAHVAGACVAGASAGAMALAERLWTATDRSTGWDWCPGSPCSPTSTHGARPHGGASWIPTATWPGSGSTNARSSSAVLAGRGRSRGQDAPT